MPTTKQAGSKLQAVVQLMSVEEVKGDLATSTDYVRRLAVPTKFTKQDIERARKDCEILAGKLQGHSDDMVTLLNAISEGRVEDAKQKARELGLEEHEFVAQGGGLMWLVVIAVLLYATNAY
jgi:hypothetical protein